MYKYDEIEFISHIYKEVQFIIESKSKLSENDFYENEIYQRAITRAFEIIGEASKKIPKNIKMRVRL